MKSTKEVQGGPDKWVQWRHWQLWHNSETPGKISGCLLIQYKNFKCKQRLVLLWLLAGVIPALRHTALVWASAKLNPQACSDSWKCRSPGKGLFFITLSYKNEKHIYCELAVLFSCLLLAVSPVWSETRSDPRWKQESGSVILLSMSKEQDCSYWSLFGVMVKHQTPVHVLLRQKSMIERFSLIKGNAKGNPSGYEFCTAQIRKFHPEIHASHSPHTKIALQFQAGHLALKAVFGQWFSLSCELKEQNHKQAYKKIIASAITSP